MKLKLIRDTFTKNSTIGSLYNDGAFICYILEDAIHDIKIQNKTAIPFGTYEVVVTQSVRFKKPMPLLLNVPNYSGVRIHSGNTAEDTEGCLLTGMGKQVDKVINSRAAFNIFFPQLVEALKKGKVFLEIV